MNVMTSPHARRAAKESGIAVGIWLVYRLLVSLSITPMQILVAVVIWILGTCVLLAYYTIADRRRDDG